MTLSLKRLPRWKPLQYRHGIHIFPSGRITVVRNLARLFHYSSPRDFWKRWRLICIEVRELPRDHQWDVLVLYKFENGHRFQHYWADRGIMFKDMVKRLKNAKWNPHTIVLMPSNHRGTEFLTPDQMIERYESGKLG